MSFQSLKELCDREFAVTELSACVYSGKEIGLKTVRSKGQLQMQRLYYINGGRTKFVLNDSETICCRKGDIVYLPPDVTYVSYWDDSADNSTLLIKFNLCSEEKSLLLSDQLFVIAHDEHEFYLKLFSMFVRIFSEGKLGYRLKCQALLLEIIYSMLPDLIAPQNESEKQTVNRGILYIENNYMKKISIDKIAKLCLLCPSVFRKRFHEATGMSPIEYKNFLTVSKAAELLRTGEYTIAEAAHEVGIDDVYYFSRLFKKQIGVSPRNYRKINCE